MTASSWRRSYPRFLAVLKSFWKAWVALIVSIHGLHKFGDGIKWAKEVGL